MYNGFLNHRTIGVYQHSNFLWAQYRSGSHEMLVLVHAYN